MSKRRDCILIPTLGDNKPSKLYKSLLDAKMSRPLINFIYSLSLQQDIRDEMINQGFTPDSRGEFSIEAVRKVLDLNKIYNESLDTLRIAEEIKARDSFGDFIPYNNPEEAIDIAIQSNNTNTGTVAYVLDKKDGTFNIIVDSRNSRTFGKVLETEKQKQTWDIIKQAFKSVSIDINKISTEFFNPTNVYNVVNWLSSIGKTGNQYITRLDIKRLLDLNEGSSQINRLEHIFGDKESIANAIYEYYHNSLNVSRDQALLIDATLNNMKKLKGLNTKLLEQTIKSLAPNKLYLDVAKSLKELKELGFDRDDIESVAGDLSSVEKLAYNALLTLERRLREVEIKVKDKTKRDDTNKALVEISRAIDRKKYYYGLTSFLHTTIDVVTDLLDRTKNLNTSGTIAEVTGRKSKILNEINSTLDGFESIVNALNNLDKIEDSSILDSIDRNRLEEQAKNVKDIIDKLRDWAVRNTKRTMEEIAINALGDTLPSGIATRSIVSMASKDSSWADFLYSAGRVSDPLIAATIGKPIRDAQELRDKRLVDISRRIRRAENALREAGINNSFMYESSGYIKSDIDFPLYNTKRRAVIDKLKTKFRGAELRQAIEEWEMANTEDRIVDSSTGRTERVPNGNYRKELTFNSKEEENYYNTMMQIKGELGTLLPWYAQHQYLPPQIRRDTLDVISNVGKEGIKKTGTALLEKLGEIYDVKEDDTEYAVNGIVINEDSVVSGLGYYDDTSIRQIPIFFINKLKDQSELLTDFSSAIQQMAAMAINYDAMNGIRDIVEFAADFIKNRDVAVRDSKGRAKVDTVHTNTVSLFRKLRSKAASNKSSILVDSILEQHLYGVKLKGDPTLNKILGAMLEYTSIKALAVNLKGMISNYVIGQLQMLMEAGAGEFYDPIDYIRAQTKVFSDNTLSAPGRIVDWVTNNENSKAVLLSRMFDPTNDNYSELSHQRYHRSIVRKLLSGNWAFMGYGAGEHMLHFTNMYAVLYHTKVKVNGKDSTLYDALTKVDKVDGNSELKVADNTTYIDEHGNEVKVDESFLNKIKGRIRYCNQTTHGSMNEEDKGVINQYMLGRFILCLRRWMIEHYSRRFRARHPDQSLGEFREGFYITSGKYAWNHTVGKFLNSMVSDSNKFLFDSARHWSTMTTEQKANCRRAIMEQFVILPLLWGLSFALGEPEDHKREFWMRMWIYQVKRAMRDLHGSTPIGIPIEATSMINSPIPSTNVVKGWLYPFYGIVDINDEVKSGRYKGWNKYGYGVYKNTVPFLYSIEQTINMDTEDDVFNIFTKGMR